MGNNYQHPDYYNRGKTEVWDIVAENELDFFDGNILKYLLRAGHKSEETRIADLLKARNYLNKKLELLGHEDEVAPAANEDDWLSSFAPDDDEWETIWSVSQDGCTARYNVSGGLNDIELYKNKNTCEYELWIETNYCFGFSDVKDDETDYLRHLRILFKDYVEKMEGTIDSEGVTYGEIFFGSALRAGNLKTLYRKFDFLVSAYCDSKAVVTKYDV